MDEFSTEVMAFMRECTGKEPQWRCVSGAGVCVDAEERLAAVIVPLDFFRSGGTAERLVSVEAAISEWYGRAFGLSGGGNIRIDGCGQDVPV